MFLTPFVVFVNLLAPSPVQDQPGWPCRGKVDPAYVRGAEATGGKVMLLKPSETGRGAAVDMIASGIHDEIVLRAGGEVEAGQFEFDVPVDSTIESVYFVVSLQCLEAASVVRPSGEEVRAEDPGVEHHAFEAVRLVVVKSPTPGSWKVRAAGSGLLTIVAAAKTDLALGSIDFSRGGAPLPTGPTLGQDVRIEATLLGTARDVAFQFFSRNGSAIQAVPLAVDRQRDYGTMYAGDAVTPAERFRVGVTGTDERGFRFQRVHHWLIFEP
jgi:hypothetical protein